MGAIRPALLKIRIGLAGKLAACLIFGTAAIFALFGYLHLRLQQQQSEQLVLLSAIRVSDIIHSSARHMMMVNDRGGMHALIRDFGAEPGIRRVRLFNEEGRIQFSTDSREVGRLVDKSAEQCFACHAQQSPLTRLNRPDRARIFRDTDGRRVLAVIRPIDNRPECSEAACHAHSPSRSILGVIDAQMTLESVDTQLAAGQKRMLLSIAMALFAMLLISVMFVWGVVHRPIQDLTRGIHDVARGNLHHRLPVRSGDELGQLAESFNRMAGDLEAARSESTEWARTLEERVRRKTEQLEQAHHSLVASEKMASLGKLAATVAHEVNNPLFGMLTYARLGLKELGREGLGEGPRQALAEYLKIIERESKRCGEIMKNLLTFARQTAPQRSRANLNTLVERAAALVRHQLEMQEIDFRFQPDPSLPEFFCDAGQIQQVLLVLLVNAAEATPNGGSITVSTRYDQERSRAVFVVADTGCGMPEEVKSQIFEPFFTTKENQHRTGLGLAIARGIVEKHGGSIDVVSEPGQGTAFTVSLPAAAEPGAGERQLAEAEGAAASSANRYSS